MLCNTAMKSFGAFHAAVEVYGKELSFYNGKNPSNCGVCSSRYPRWHPVHIYRQSINMGTTALTKPQVRDLIRWQLAPHWSCGRYDIIHCNCIHFCDELLQ